MPSSDLTIEFGGLCLFVERNDAQAKGLYVLLPRVQDASMPAHCPTLVIHSRAGDGVAMPFDAGGAVNGPVLDLGDIAGGGSPAADPSGLAQTSKYVNGTPVEDRYLTQPPSGALAARVRLPLGTSIEPFGKPAQLKDPDGNLVAVYGRVRVHVPPYGPIREFVRRLAGTGAEVVLSVLNIPAYDLRHAGSKYHHHKDWAARHIRAYYALLGVPPRDFTYPGEINPGYPDDPPPDSCISAPTRVHIPPAATGPQIEFIDPYNCTVGYGT